MSINFEKITGTIETLIQRYKESGGDSASFAPAYQTEKGLNHWQEVFAVLDEEIDHGSEAIYEGPEGRLDYLGNVGEPYWLLTREYMLVIKRPIGNIYINYTPGAMQDIKIRSARIMIDKVMYIIKENSDSIIDYPFEGLI